MEIIRLRFSVEAAESPVDVAAESPVDVAAAAALAGVPCVSLAWPTLPIAGPGSNTAKVNFPRYLDLPGCWA
jgi:hypothetical protein